MKHALALSILTSILILGAPEAHAKSKRGKKTALSASRPVAAALEALAVPPPEVMKQPRASFWMAQDPHVPLAMVNGKAIQSVGKRGKDCGAMNRWAKQKSRWHAVNEWGQVTGLYEVKGSEILDVTSCREVSFAQRAGKGGVGLFVSEDSGYTPGESAAFTPGAAEKRHFEHFLGQMENDWVNHKPLGKAVPSGKRTMFFQMSGKDDGRVDGAGKRVERPTRWAVSGGPILVVAYLGQNGRWKAASVKAPLGLADSYMPVAVFDMNGDGIPEIVYQSSDGPSFADAVLSLDPETMVWSDAAESPGGAML